MDDSGFLRDLARAAREEEAEEQQRWGRWDRLTDGALSPDEEAELKALAASSVEDEKAFEAFRPLSADFRDRMVDKIRPVPVPVEPPRPVWEKILDWLSTWRRRAIRLIDVGPVPAWRVGFIGSGVAVAAAALFWVHQIHHSPPLPRPVLTVAALPAYTLKVEPSVFTERGGETTPNGPVALAPGDSFGATATPDETLSSQRALGVLGLVVPSSPSKRDFQPIVLKIVKSHSGGALQLTGTVPPNQAPGPATLWVVVGYLGQLPKPEVVTSFAPNRKRRSPHWVAMPTQIEIRAP